eukprot:TRINITY_DN13404_c0_g1_i1.p1 TRINITY_DN13404_c0_g1~~TRINITY_DN13404_c0_g1_i1.p1  ORF type:complete len:571 (+),score=73.64 TRINITY_DN13404_c0_g1_i1:127-1839(+)
MYFDRSYDLFGDSDAEEPASNDFEIPPPAPVLPGVQVQEGEEVRQYLPPSKRRKIADDSATSETLPALPLHDQLLPEASIGENDLMLSAQPRIPNRKRGRPRIHRVNPPPLLEDNPLQESGRISSGQQPIPKRARGRPPKSSIDKSSKKVEPTVDLPSGPRVRKPTSNPGLLCGAELNAFYGTVKPRIKQKRKPKFPKQAKPVLPDQNILPFWASLFPGQPLIPDLPNEAPKPKKRGRPPKIRQPLSKKRGRPPKIPRDGTPPQTGVAPSASILATDLPLLPFEPPAFPVTALPTTASHGHDLPLNIPSDDDPASTLAAWETTSVEDAQTSPTLDVAKELTSISHRSGRLQKPSSKRMESEYGEYLVTLKKRKENGTESLLESIDHPKPAKKSRKKKVQIEQSPTDQPQTDQPQLDTPQGEKPRKPFVPHKRFSPEEDKQILELVAELRGPTGLIPWSSVAERMGGHRSIAALQGRYKLYLSPGGVTFRPWTPSEDSILIAFPKKEHKTPWVVLSTILDRNPKEIFNHYHVLRRKGLVMEENDQVEPEIPYPDEDADITSLVEAAIAADN